MKNTADMQGPLKERSFETKLAGLSLIVAPALLLLANAIDPSASAKAAARLPEISNNPARYVAAGYLMVLAAWAFVPGLIGVWRLFHGPRVTVGQVGTGLLLIGMITTIAFFGFGVYEYEAATSGLDPAQMARLADNAEASAVAIPLLVVFLVGVVVGTILNFLADSAALSATAFAFQIVGFGWIGLRLLRGTGATADAWHASSTTSSATA